MGSNSREVEFNVNAYTARLIGRENVSKLEGAVLEIVKNAYDADAKVFCLYYCEAHDCIYIMDNGVGMEEEIIRKHWMTIGNSSKRSSYVTEKKRVQTGAKGIGRFALDRLADVCNMYTVSSAGGIEWSVDWRDFNGSSNLPEVKARLTDMDEKLLEYVSVESWPNKKMAQLVNSLDFTGNGTVFCLEKLHDEWDSATMSRIKNHLENLLSPDVVLDFKVFFFADDTSPEDAEIISSNIDNFDYRISFQVQGEGVGIRILRNEFDFEPEEETIFKEAGFDKAEQAYFHGKIKELEFSFEQVGEKKNLIGDFWGIFYFNKISTSINDRRRFYYRDISGRRNLTKEFGGIKVYRDHFRVRPYGEYGDNDFDWLELSARKNRSPSGFGSVTGNWRVGAEQIMGVVAISRENTNLEDASNRNGIQEGEGFWQLKRLILIVIQEFERDRQSVGRKLAEYARVKQWRQIRRDRLNRYAVDIGSLYRNIGVQLPVFASDESEIVPVGEPLESDYILELFEEEKGQEIKELRDEVKMLQALATTGILVNMFMHEIRTLTNNIGQELDAAFEAIKYDEDMEAAFENIQRAIVFKKNFAFWFGVTIDSIKKDKRKRKVHNLRNMLTKFLDTWDHILKRENVRFDWECDIDIEIRCFEFDMENIISNLISNSLCSFDREAEMPLEKKEILLNFKKRTEGFLITYEDTGWGLVPKYKERPELILEAIESDRGEQPGEKEVEGTGMGMWIVNKTVKEYNGSIDLSVNRQLKRGFRMLIRIGGQDV
ncbi:sensor histidine kinase [Sporofaciens musculi]|uniref:sensor histidine kinase n=1 Tax=Sporofaciens musculi TaxID=2681861 RepID=UPI0025A1031D|nr:sensor histidine kinase [Sporofaciens musculi]